MPVEGNIIIKGARVNNLKNITVEIPRNKFTVITGVSGSGKSSLAFDTLFAEGQRRFAESLSSYARQFLGRMSKPDVDKIIGIPPAVAIEQRVTSRNPRSTVATMTEVYDYLKTIFSKIGRTFSPISGEEVKCHTVKDVLAYITSDTISGDVASKSSSAASELSEKTKKIAYVLADLHWNEREDKVELLLKLKEEGYSRLFNGEILRIEEIMQLADKDEFPSDIYLLVDRLSLPFFKDGYPYRETVEAGKIAFEIKEWEDLRMRLLSSIETAFQIGEGTIHIMKNGEQKVFRSRFELDGIVFKKPEEYLFSFNSPLGACQECGGLGKIIGISEDLVIPDKSKSIYDGAIACWRGEKMQWFKEQIIKLSSKYDIPIFEPYCRLSSEVKNKIWKGVRADTEEESIIGIDEFFKWVESNRYKVQYKYMLTRFSGKATCHACNGSRLTKEALYVRVGGKNIAELLAMNVEQLFDFLQNIQIEDFEKQIVKRAIEELTFRLNCIKEVGLGYLNLSRNSNTLSGGENQRLNLVSALGNALVGSMYILDEPSVGLHPRDTSRLISVIKKLRDIGNTVVIVEHDEEIIRSADTLIDMGPEAGMEAGEVVFSGEYRDDLPLDVINNSLTLQYLSHKRKTYIRKKHNWQHYICVEGAMEHNLKNINVKFPLGILTVVSGVSGSGKSSLVGDILYPALYRHINQIGALPGAFKKLSGDLSLIKSVEYVDQNPIGKSSRSNAVTYLKIYDDIRRLFAEQPYAKLNNYTPSFFSFNQDGGRCPECNGDGFVKISMQFMADINMLCESCNGKRFKQDILEVKYSGKNIDDILNMTVAQAIEFFSEQKESIAKNIVKKLQSLIDVGLSYIKLGQSSSTLSGGESQRIKLASFLANKDDKTNYVGQQESNEHFCYNVNDGVSVFIFDEPTTGLHFFDVEKLLKAFDALIERGHSVIVVEHNPDVIKAADWIIDLGPDAGDRGGELVFEGTPDMLINNSASFTAQYIRQSLSPDTAKTQL